MQTHPKLRIEAACARRLFPQTLIDHYQTLNLGRIRAIITVDQEEPLLFVTHLSHLLLLVCRIDTSETFTHPGIQTGLDLDY